MRYLKMTLPALILIAVLVIALVIYPDMAKSYQERENAAAQQSEAKSTETEAQSNAEISTAAESQPDEEASAADEEQASEESPGAADEQSEAGSQDSAAASGTEEVSAAEESGSEEASAAAESVLTNTAPDFEIKDAYGMNGKLSNHFGKPIVVNFWATWCPFCVQELPLFDKYAREYSGDIDFMIVDLADGYRETIEMAKKYVADYGYSFPVYFDTTGGSMYAYGITGIPVTLFIDSDGNLMTQYVGAIDEDTLLRNIQALGDNLQQ